ncbi:MAG: hypothetical protein PVH19_09665 [Planctomycetia bacterium]|jgi:hypothetical protein
MKKYLIVLALIFPVAFCGCGDDEESVATKLGNQVGNSVTDFAQGVGEGVDEKMKVPVEVNQKMLDRGLKSTVAKWTIEDAKKGISVYIVAETAFEGTLIVKAYDKDDLEIGRTEADVVLGDDDAKHVLFAFPDNVDTQLVKKYRINIRKEGPIAKPVEKTEAEKKETPPVANEVPAVE